MRVVVEGALAIAACSLLAAPASHGAEPLRAGIIGCDTSHARAFAALLNDEESQHGVRVTAAFPGGSPDLPASRDRVDGYVKQLADSGVTIVDSIDSLVEQCDVILLESVDGRVHLEQFREAAVGKPVFIDKPAAASLADVREIFRIADRTHTPAFTSSALRFCDQVRELKADAALGEMIGAETSTPYHKDATHPDFFWYAIHGVESLFALMGSGCASVSCVESDTAAVITGRWHDGRLGVVRGIKRGKEEYVITAFGAKDVAQRRGFSGYQPLVGEIAKFFAGGAEPVERQETLEIFAFMEAAQESQENGGREVTLEAMFERAEKAAGE
jgi:hypothetical protein